MKKSSNNSVSRILSSDGVRSFGSSIICILIGLLIGFVIMLFSSLSLKDADPLAGLGVLFSGPFTALKPVKELGNMIFFTVPLIFTSLSVAIAYKTGLFNIGAPGQFLMGTMA
ncbi:MAG: ABC transporter permease, partial [Bacilli bacterium]